MAIDFSHIYGLIFGNGNKKQDKDFDKEKAKELESKLMENLEIISSSYKEEQSSLEDYLPEAQEFDYKEYKGLTDGELEEKAKSDLKVKYGDGIRVANEKYEETVNKLGGSLDAAKQKTEAKREEADADYEDFMAKAGQYALKNGLAYSSVKTLTEDSLSKDRESTLKALTQLFEKELENYSKAASDAEKAKQESLYKLNLDYETDLAKKLDTYKAAEEKNKAATEKENDKTGEAERKYNEALKKAQQKYEEDCKAQSQNNAEYEAVLNGEKAENYQKRLDAALEVYSRLPKDKALELIRQNKDLERYLGAFYGRLLQAINA